MAQAILIIGDSGQGKSTSLRNLNPKETYIFNVNNKPLPFKNGRTDYSLANKNIHHTDNVLEIINIIKVIKEKRTDIKNIVIDDMNYLMQNEFIRRSKEKGYEKFTEIGTNFANLIHELRLLPEHIFPICIMHPEVNTDTFGNKTYKAKTVGKLVDQYLNIEGMFSIVLYCKASKDENQKLQYNFITQSDGTTSAKSPMGMLNETEPNDMEIIINKIKEYYK